MSSEAAERGVLRCLGGSEETHCISARFDDAIFLKLLDRLSYGVAHRHPRPRQLFGSFA
jgi:hypothetical protein